MLLREGSTRIERTNEAWTSNVVGGGTVHMSAFFFRYYLDYDFGSLADFCEMPVPLMVCRPCPVCAACLRHVVDCAL